VPAPNKHPSPLEILSGQRWDRALFTTFALSLSFFESYVLRELRSNGCRPWVITDQMGYQDSLLEGRATAVGREYRLIPVSMPNGVFHPKIIYLSGAEGDVLMVGSGNLTFGGFGRNLEVIEILQPEDAPQVFTDFAQFLTTLDGREDIVIPNRDWIREFTALATKAGSSGEPSEQSPRLLHSLNHPVADQLTQLAKSQGSPKSLLALSPFFDRDGRGIKALVEKLAVRSLKIGLPTLKSEPSTFPFASAARWKVKVEAVVPEVPKNARSLHAKCIEIACGRRLVGLTGSVNATYKALCTTENVELGVVRVMDARGSFVHWKSARNQKENPVVARNHSEQTGPLLVHVIVNYGGRAKGRFVSGKGVEGKWSGYITWNTRRETPVSTVVSADGGFQFELSEGDAQILGSSAQIHLQQGKREARGWIQNDAALTLPPQLTPVIRSLGGQATEDDDLALLDYLATHALEHLTSFGRRLGPGRLAATDPESTSTTTVHLTELAPRIESEQGAESERLVTAQTASAVVDHIMTRLRHTMLQRHDGIVDESVEMDGSESEEGTDGMSELKAEEARRERVSDALDRFDHRMRKIIEECDDDPNGNSARAAFLVLWLDVKFSFLLTRVRSPVRARSFLYEWFFIATELPVSGTGSDALREHVVTAAVLLAADSIGKDDASIRPARLREQLENCLKPDIDSAEAQETLHGDPLSSFASDLFGSDQPHDLNSVLLSMWSTKTIREQIAEILSAYKAGTPIDRTLPVFAGKSGEGFFEALTRPSRIPWVKELTGSPTRCAHCSEAMGGDQQIDLVQQRFAHCIQCKRYTVWLE